MQLPDINGDQIARIVRARKEFDGLPLVALTANVRRAEEDLAGVKMQGSLAKPINTRKLDNVLARLFPHSTKSITEQASSSLSTNFAMADVDQAILDSETITDFFESMGVAPFARGVQLFEKLWPTYIAELNSALDARTFSEYKSIAHKLKGAAGSVALRAVQQRAKYMEDNAESADLEQLSRWLDELPSEIEKGLKALNLVIENNH
jgi:two-component system aerobic respiration control sensor histidine kinase ArcB